MRKSIGRAAIASVGVMMLVACGGEGGGGSSANDGEETLTIGVIAPLSGPSAHPASKSGVEAAQQHINDVLGGIGGRQLDFSWCESDGTPEFVVNCANRFVQ